MDEVRVELQPVAPEPPATWESIEKRVEALEDFCPRPELLALAILPRDAEALDVANGDHVFVCGRIVVVRVCDPLPASQRFFMPSTTWHP